MHKGLRKGAIEKVVRYHGDSIHSASQCVAAT